jgi:hypothetical protein
MFTTATAAKTETTASTLLATFGTLLTTFSTLLVTFSTLTRHVSLQISISSYDGYLLQDRHSHSDSRRFTVRFTLNLTILLPQVTHQFTKNSLLSSSPLMIDVCYLVIANSIHIRDSIPRHRIHPTKDCNEHTIMIHVVPNLHQGNLTPLIHHNLIENQ